MTQLAIKRFAAVLLALLTAAQLASAQTCPAAPWRSLPLAKKPATLAQLDLSNWQGYIKGSLVPHVLGAAVAAVISILLLLSFIAWRLVKCCTCCACVRGPQRTGKKARKLLASSGAVWLKAAAVAAAAGVLAGGVYGVTQVQAVMVDSGLAAIDTVTAFIESALAAGSATLAATQALDNQLLVVKDGLVGLGPMIAGLVAPYTQAIDNTHSSLASFHSFGSDLDTIRTNTVDRIDRAITDYSPVAQRADKWRAIGLYIAYGAIVGLAVVATFAVLVDWPATTKPLVLIFLVLILLAWIIVVALTVVLRVGNDVCVNVEDKLLEVASGSGSFSLGGGGSSGGAAALMQYYLLGTGGTVFMVLNSTLSIDVDAQLSLANATLIDLQGAIANNPALSALSPDFDQVALLFSNVSASIDVLEIALSYSSFHPVWVTLKAYLCCDLLNSVGSTWTALIITSSFGLLLLLLAFVWISRMDKLRALGCCHIYAARDYSLEGDCGDDHHQQDGSPLHLSPEKHKKGGVGLAPISCPHSPIMARKESHPVAPASPSTSAAAGIKGSRVAPAPLFHSMSTGEPVAVSSPLYPPISSEAGAMPYRASSPLPSPAVAIPGISFPPGTGDSFLTPNEAELRAEAHRAAQLAGRAFSMATQAQNLLDTIARTNSNVSATGQMSNAPNSPNSPHASNMPSSPPSWTAAPQHFPPT